MISPLHERLRRLEEGQAFPAEVSEGGAAVLSSRNKDLRVLIRGLSHDAVYMYRNSVFAERLQRVNTCIHMLELSLRSPIETHISQKRLPSKFQRKTLQY